MNNDLISRSALKKHITEIFEIEEKHDKKWALGLRYSLKLIDNAPTVEPDVNCSHCDYFKFSKSFIENIVGFMLKHNIETVDDLMTELNRINELLGGAENKRPTGECKCGTCKHREESPCGECCHAWEDLYEEAENE